MNSSQWHLTLLFVLAFLTVALLAKASKPNYFKVLMDFPCFKKKYNRLRFKCKNNFFLSFRSNPFQICSTRAKVLVDCRLAVDQQCLLEADKTSFVYKNYVGLNMKPNYKKAIKEYCHDAGLFSPFIEPAAMRKIGCSMKLYIAKSNCIRSFQRKWRHNRGSKLLCHEYEAMGACTRKAADDHCSQEAVEKMENTTKLLASLVSGRNPFC